MFARGLACALLVTLCGCGSSSAPVVGVSGASAVSGLIGTPGTTTIAGTIDQGGDQRSYIGIVPDAPVAGAPLLVMLHPLATTNVEMANLTRVGRLAADDGAIVVLPQGENDTWNDELLASGPDDLGFISTLIGNIAQQYQTDPSRVYVMGFSEGGFMTETLVCNLSSTIAAACRSIPASILSRCSGSKSELRSERPPVSMRKLDMIGISAVGEEQRLPLSRLFQRPARRARRVGAALPMLTLLREQRVLAGHRQLRTGAEIYPRRNRGREARQAGTVGRHALRPAVG